MRSGRNRATPPEITRGRAWSPSPGGGEGERTITLRLGGDLCFVFVRFAQDVAAAPHRFDIILAARSVGEFFPQLADEDVDNLEFRFVHSAIEMVEKHLFGERRALAQ